MASLTDFKELQTIPVTIRTMLRIVEGVKGIRTRVEDIATCQTEDEILALPWMNNVRPIGRLSNVEQMGISQPMVRQTFKDICVGMGTNQYAYHGGWPEDVPLRTDELDIRNFTNATVPLFSDKLNNGNDYPESQITDYKLDKSISFDMVGGYIGNAEILKIPINIVVWQQTNLAEPVYALNMGGNNAALQCYVKYKKGDTITKYEKTLQSYDGVGFWFGVWTNGSGGWLNSYGFGEDNLMYYGNNTSVGAYTYNLLFNNQANFWIFETEQELNNYFNTGDYTAAINYSDPLLDADYMDLNIPGNSVVKNASYQFVDPVAGLCYDSPQQIKIEWTISGATANPNVSKITVFNIPANLRAFVLFDGKYLGLYCSGPGVTMKMDVYNNGALIGTVNKQSDTGLLEVENIFGMYEGYEPEGGSYDVKIFTPFIFIRQIYNCAKKEELPKKGEPTYEIFQPGTSSRTVNPDGTGKLASVHLLSFNSIGAMKSASDAEDGGV